MPSNHSDREKLDKPLIHFHITKKPLGDLLGHEQIIKSQVDWLKANILKLGYFFRPVLIVKNHNVVLDGHHRVEALKELGYSYIPCIEINYVDNKDISLGTWYPIYVKKSKKNFPSELDKIGIKWENLKKFTPQILENKNCGFILKTQSSHYILYGNQKEIFHRFLNSFDSKFFEYVKTLKSAVFLVENRKASYALLRSRITKKNVLKTALKKELYAPKTTRHILSFRYQDIKVPLESLL